MQRNFYTTMLWTWIFLTSFLGTVRGDVTTYPAPEGEKNTEVYTVTVNGQAVDVYTAMSQEDGDDFYYFASFDFSEHASVEIRSALSLESLTWGPERDGVTLTKSEDDTIHLEADAAFQISLEPNGRVKPLLLFGNEPDKAPITSSQDQVIYFGPGVHHPGKIVLKDNQTLYLSGGSVVKGAVLAEGKNIVICGRGILAGEDSPRFSGPGRFLLDGHHCENLQIRDIILRNPWSWTLVVEECQNVLIDNVKICGSRMINDDAFDLINSQNVVVRNCFFRTQDDCIAIKGLQNSQTPCENILVEDCIFWTDKANIFRIGYECETPKMSNIVAKNIDILFYSRDYRSPENYWANCIFWLQPNQNMLMEDCHFENIRIRSNGQDIILLMAKPMSCSYGAFKDPEPGRLQNCSFRNIRVDGLQDHFNGMIYFNGPSAEHDINNFVFENIQYFGEPIQKDSPCVQIHGSVQNVEFQ